MYSPKRPKGIVLLSGKITVSMYMATKATAPKTRKPKTNNYVSILEQFLEKCNLSASFTPEQLSEHAPELDALLPD
ncbi:hypothetical protein C1645_842635 [Glomus cerebriforme]|uniref:Uncharacterized protein n=1 Tax=Glomus cerebriforme TaxID=658196 RepID=A0A397RWF8_9GLOM|nr:hypothetical protein C1645_842635 [Glomus cerebriforme]